jgi:hypothetical protein
VKEELKWQKALWQSRLYDRSRRIVQGMLPFIPRRLIYYFVIQGLVLVLRSDESPDEITAMQLLWRLEHASR